MTEYLCLMVFVYFLFLFLRLKAVAAGIVFLELGIELFYWKRSRKKAAFKWQQFEDTALYMELLLYTFLREGKILTALEGVETALPVGKIRDTVSDAAAYLRLAYEETEVAEKALNKITAAFPCRRLETIHQFMLHVENYGGNPEDTVKILLEDKRHWEERIRKEKTVRKEMETQVLLSALVSIGICGALLYMPVGNVDISGSRISQGLAVLVTGLDGLIVVKAAGPQAADWLNMEDSSEEEKEAKKIERYRNYDRAKEHRLSVILSGLGLGLCLLCMIRKKKLWLAGALGLTLVFFYQDKIGENLMKRRIREIIKRAFPNWLLDMVLLMQSENVQVAMQRSVETAPLSLRRELELMNGKVEMNPESAAPYQEFLREFELPQVRSAMSLLYSVSIGSTALQDKDQRLMELIRSNLEMLDAAEGRRMKEQDSGLYLLFLAPVLTGSAKLIADMTLYLLTLLSWR